MKSFLLVILLFFPSTLFSNEISNLANKAIICKEGNDTFKSMYGFKFIDEVSVQVLIKNSDTVDVLTDNILKYNTNLRIYIYSLCICLFSTHCYITILILISIVKFPFTLCSTIYVHNTFIFPF